jgi:PAS domain S-box-containing protein
VLEPSLPEYEAERLAALLRLGILDTPTEERFDRITRVARRLFDVPIALVSLVDANRPWFKSCLGLEVDSTSRAESFCGYALLQDGCFVIPDALLDERFQDNLLVTGAPYIRFYAGHPVYSHRQPIGTLCLLDRRPREFNQDDRRALADLAAMVERELETHHVGTLMRTSGDQISTERALAASEERYRELFDHTSDIIHAATPEGNLLFANPAWRSAFGYNDEPLDHVCILDRVAQPDRSRYAELRRRVLAGQRSGLVAFTFLRCDGSTFSVEGELTARVVGGVATLTHGIFRDVTVRREADRMKDEFLRLVSHELRTPLTAMRGALGLLAANIVGELPPKGKRLLDIAVTSTERLTGLINDILDVERLAYGTLDLKLGTHDATALMQNAADGLAGLAARAGMTLKVVATDLTLEVDSDRIIQVLTNLIGNAIKFSARGGTITISAASGSDGPIMSVADNGCGIPADRLVNIFERFQQVDASDTRERGGTGLGLAVCRGIVLQHGGHIWAESDLEKGSTFHFSLRASTPLEISPVVRSL